MDLVKIGFLIQANGLKDANKEVDSLLNRVDQIGTKGKKAAADFESAQKKVQGSSKNTEKTVVTASERMIKKQEALHKFLQQPMDKQTANLAAKFSLVSDSAQDLNRFLGLVGQNKAFVQLQRDAAALEKARQQTFSQEQKDYQKRLASAKATEANIAKDAEVSRQKKYKAEQDYHNKTMDVEKAKIAQAKAVQEAARQQRYRAEQDYYNKVVAAEKAKVASAEKAQETARQKRFKAEQDYYNKQMAQAQSLRNADKARYDQQQRAIDLVNKSTAYRQQGFTTTNANKLASMELSGADANTLRSYKQALLDAQTAVTGLGNSTQETAKKTGFFNSQIGGIVKYAVLSAAIYGTMSAIMGLGAAMVKMSDEYTSIQNRMKLYIADTQELTKVNSQLAVMSMQNNIGLRETSTLFTRLAPAMQKIGANTAAITAVVDSFGKSLRIGGATLMEASSATIQFSQAMASGKLAGDEFRSISEASPRFLRAIAEGSGIAADQLKRMSAAGLLTTEVISRALLKEYPKLIEENKRLGITLEQGANSMKTSFQVMFGEFNEGAGITATLGSALTDMAMGLFDTAKSARESGIAFKEWAGSVKDEAVVALELLKFAAISYASYMAATFAVVIGKAIASVVSSFVALGIATAAYYQASAMGATRATAAMLTMKAAVQGVGAAMAAVSLASWATLLLTVGGIAAAYLMFRDSASEATQKLVEQSKYADITTESYRQLNKEQQKNALFDTEDKLIKANKKVEESYQDVISVVKEYQAKQTLRPDIDSVDVSKVLKGLESGTLAFDTAYRTLKEMGVPDSVINSMMEGTEEYVKTATAANTLAEQAKVMGSNLTLSGSAAQNATLPMKGYGDSISNLAENAKIATNEVGKLVKELNIKLSETKLSYSIENSTGLGQKYSSDIASDAVSKAAAKEADLNKKNIDALAKLNELRQKGTNLAHVATTSNGKVQADAITQLEKNTEELMKQSALYNKLKTQSPLVKVDPLTLVDPKAVAVAKELEALDKKRAERDAARNKTNKDEDKDLKRLESIREGYDDQIAAVVRLNNFKAEGMAYDVAKIAAEKDYYEAYTNVDKAFEIAEARKQLARIDATGSLENEAMQQKVLIGLMAVGADYDTARAAAQAGFMADAEGRIYAEKAMSLAMQGQSQSLKDQSVQQYMINQGLREGLSLEEATFQAQRDRLKALRGKSSGKVDEEYRELQKAAEANRKLLEVRLAEAKALQEIEEAQRQTAIYQTVIAAGATRQAEALARIKADNKGISDADAKAKLSAEEGLALSQRKIQDQLTLNSLLAGEDEATRSIKDAFVGISEQDLVRLYHNQKLVGILQEQADLAAEAKKNPLGDFSSVNFEAFGDFGNPLESALEGVNQYLAGLSVLEEKMGYIKQQQIDLNKAKDDYKGDTESKEYKALTEQITALSDSEEKYLKQKKEGQIAAWGQGLSLAKSLFKEETKGYKIISGLEKAYQAGVIAFKLWEKKDEIQTLALELGGYVKSTAAFLASAGTKVAAQAAVNVSKGVEAALTQGTGDPYTAFARIAAMVAVVAGLGVAIGSVSGGSSGSFAPTNEGTGTVFGGAADDKSESIAKAMEILAENSELGLPISSAMLKSLQNIESNIGGLANLVIRGGVGTKLAGGVVEGFTPDALGKAFTSVANTIDKLTGGFMATFNFENVVTKILGSLFGSKTSIKGQGLSGGSQALGSVLGGGFSLQEYVDIQTKKKTFGITTSTKNSTQYSKASEELSQQFTMVFQNLNDSILGAAPLLGQNLTSVTDKLNKFVVNIGRVDLRGLSGEEIQERLTAVIGAEADKMAQAAISGLGDFQKVGEGYYETLVRVAAGVEEAQYYTERLNVATVAYTALADKQGNVAAEIVRQSILAAEGSKRVANGFYDLVNAFTGTAGELADFVGTLRNLQDAIYATGKSGDYLTSTMILGAGGADALENGLEAYFELLSPTEQVAEMTRRLTNEFAIFGKQLPSDVKAFRDLVNGIDITTAAGQKLYGQVIALTPEFSDLQDALDDVKKEAKAAADEAKKLAAEFEAMMVKLRQAIYITGQSASNITQAMIDAAGGGDALLKGLEAIYGMLTPAEKATELTRRMSLAFGNIGQALPSTNEAFRELIGGLDTSTKAGQELFGKLVILTPEFLDLQAALTTVADELAKVQAEALEAAKAAAEAAKILASLQQAFYITGQSASRMTQVMIDAAGGTDALRGGLEAMFSMLTPAEQATELTRRLTEQFEALGLKLPTSTSGFRDLVKYMDTSTSAGQKLAGQVIALAPEFNTLQTALEQANNEVNELVQSLRDLATEASQAAGETNQPQNLEVLRNQFNSEALLAMQGDAAASERLLSLGQSLMDTSKQYSVNGSDYARDLAMIQRAATVSADMQEVGLGYTPPALNSMTGSSGTSIETTNSSTDAKLDALRADMITAITAVAKYTQDTANRLERWDYGDRVNVHVDQDALDKPIPVKVV